MFFSGLVEQFRLYWSYEFVRNAFIVGTFIALCSSLFGVTLVLRRYSFIGDGLSHVAFGAMAIATALSLTKINMDMSFILIITIICAVLLLRGHQKNKINGDAQLAMLSVGALAIGYLIINRFSTSSNISSDVCTTLFGSTSILTLTKDEVYLSVVLSIVVVLIFILLYNKIFAITFDEDFAISNGVNADFYNLVISIIIAIIIVLSMKLVGSLLISALIIFPALSSMRLFKTFKSVTICSAFFSVICSLIGLLFSILVDTPVGSTIVFIDIIAFLLFSFLGYIKGGIRIWK